MKKILSYVLTFVIAITVTIGFGSAEVRAAGSTNQISLETAEGILRVGDTTNIAIVASNVDDLYALQFTVRYDPNLVELIGITYKETSTPEGVPLKFVQIARTEKDAGSLKEVSYALAQSISDVEEVYEGTLPEAVIGEIAFRLKADGVADISIVNVYSLESGSDFTRIESEDFTVHLVIADPDVSGNDGKVQINDLTAVAGAFMKSSGDEGYSSRYDMNKDGIIDLADIVYVAKIILNS